MVSSSVAIHSADGDVTLFEGWESFLYPCHVFLGAQKKTLMEKEPSFLQLCKTVSRIFQFCQFLTMQTDIHIDREEISSLVTFLVTS